MDIVTTNGARKIIAEHFNFEDFNLISKKDIIKFFKIVYENGDVNYWEQICQLPKIEKK